MEIYTSTQIQQWDKFTIENEPVSSIDLMERAANTCFNWLMEHGYKNRQYTIYCGKGNNGGDGLAIARLLSVAGYQVTANILEFGHKGTDDFQQNLTALHATTATVRFISIEKNLQFIKPDGIVIDAIFGSGLNRKPEGLNASIINHINASGATVISIDIPSGISADNSSVSNVHIVAKHTLCFQVYKMAFLMPENENACGEVHLLNINLHPGFHRGQESVSKLIDKSLIKTIYKPRKDFGHKGSYGHSLLIAGSYGKIGAAVLSTNACLRSGTGLCTIHVPGCGYQVLQIACPEAMTETDVHEKFNTPITYNTDKYAAIGIGPGLGQEEQSAALLRRLIADYRKPLVIDADALNILSQNNDLLQQLPPGTILTPHPKEFARLFGPSANDFERIELAAQQASHLNVIIVLKGHYSLVATPGIKYFNSTGNAGMATGGTGDALTGIITGLLAQGYEPADAAILGVYLHGLAGDIASRKMSKESLIASDLVSCLGEAYLDISTTPEILSIPEISGMH